VGMSFVQADIIDISISDITCFFLVKAVKAAYRVVFMIRIAFLSVWGKVLTSFNVLEVSLKEIPIIRMIHDCRKLYGNIESLAYLIATYGL
jgi:hypothetical protein